MFGLKTEKNRNQKQSEEYFDAAPGTSIRFNPRLTEQLTQEHQELLDIYIRISNSIKAFDAKGVAEGMKQMKDLLQSHLLTENIRLFVYLDHVFANDDVNRQLVREFRREMDQIARGVMAFFNRYQDIGSGKYPLDEFAKEFEELGVALNKRIEKEEQTLYPLYLAQY